MTKRANGEGSVYELTDGRWCAVLDVTAGRTRRRRVKRIRTTERAARSALRELRLQYEQGVALEREAALTVGAWLTRWLESGDRKPTTQRSYAQIVRDYLEPYISGEPLPELTVSRLQRWVEQLARTDGRRHRFGTRGPSSAPR